MSLFGKQRILKGEVIIQSRNLIHQTDCRNGHAKGPAHAPFHYKKGLMKTSVIMEVLYIM